MWRNPAQRIYLSYNNHDKSAQNKRQANTVDANSAHAIYAGVHLCADARGANHQPRHGRLFIYLFFMFASANTLNQSYFCVCEYYLAKKRVRKPVCDVFVPSIQQPHSSGNLRETLFCKLPCQKIV